MTISVAYPKIETLYNRDPETFVVKTDELRLPEFGLVNKWILTEKVDGTNVRIGFDPDGSVEFGGRTDNAQMPVFLVNYLKETFTPNRFFDSFSEGGSTPRVILFGEGYGPKIQKGGGLYRSDVSFRLFDVWVEGWWLNIEDIQDVARKMGIETVPILRTVDELPISIEDLEYVIRDSVVAKQDGGEGLKAEGVVARTDPLLFTRRGQRLVWKLKFKDFYSGRR